MTDTTPKAEKIQPENKFAENNPESTVPVVDENYNPHDDEVLAYAWDLYETYSTGSRDQKKQNSKVRLWIIMLIFLTSTLAVFNALPGMDWVKLRVFDVLLPWTGALVSDRALSIILIALSVSTTAMLSYASQFTPLKAWVMYRIGADRIRSEIYLYRTMAAEIYANHKLGEQKTRELFLDRIEEINRQIYELETAPPFLQLMERGKKIKPSLSLPRRMMQRFERFILFPFYLIWRLIQMIQRAFKRTRTAPSTTPKKPSLSGRYYRTKDDGFNLISGNDYLLYRAIPQRDWYVEKVYEDYEQLKDWRRVMLVLGGLSAVLAAVQQEPYIVITTAATVAINTHIQLNLIGSTYGNYHVSASRLDAQIVRWRNMVNREAHEHVVEFVRRVEQILEEERVIWMQQTSHALQESEQALVKGSARRGDVPTIVQEADVKRPIYSSSESTKSEEYEAAANTTTVIPTSVKTVTTDSTNTEKVNPAKKLDTTS